MNKAKKITKKHINKQINQHLIKCRITGHLIMAYAQAIILEYSYGTTDLKAL